MTIVMWTMVAWCGVETMVGGRGLAGVVRGRPSRVSAADTLDLFAMSARRGASPSEMVERCVRHLPPEAARPLLPVARAFVRGARADVALGLAEVDSESTLGVSLGALSDVARHGGSLADELSRLSLDARRLESAEVAAAARRLSVRLTAPLVVCHLPAFVLVGVAPALIAGQGAV